MVLTGLKTKDLEHGLGDFLILVEVELLEEVVGQGIVGVHRLMIYSNGGLQIQADAQLYALKRNSKMSGNRKKGRSVGWSIMSDCMGGWWVIGSGLGWLLKEQIIIPLCSLFWDNKIPSIPNQVKKYKSVKPNIPMHSLVLRCSCFLKRVYNIHEQLNLQLQMTDRDSTSKNTGTFSLIRLLPECKLLPVRVDFIAPQMPLATPTSIVPSFNLDRAHFTPCFILPLDQRYYQENLTFERFQFEEKIQRSVQEINSVSSSQPSQEIRIIPPNSDYCQICQRGFSDYFEHIKDKTHRNGANHSQATGLIKALCKELQGACREANGMSKSKPVRKAGRKEQSWRGKVRGNKKQEMSKGQGSSKGGNFSTCLVQDCSIGQKQ